MPKFLLLNSGGGALRLNSGGALLVNQQQTNWAAAANGGSVTATSEASGYAATNIINGLRHTNNDWGGITGGWSSQTGVSQPHTLDFSLAAPKVITQINIFTLRNDINYNTNPTFEDPADVYGARDFTVEYLDVDTYVTLLTVKDNVVVGNSVDLGGTVMQFFRIVVTVANGGESRFVEVEALD